MISVVIPTLDEAAHLPATLASLAAQRERHEAIVVDGGSTDSTRELARNSGAAFFICGRRQRAAQMNAGAGAAHGEVLLFLHADTRLPHGALARIEGALADPAVLGGGFARRYDSPSPVLRLTCALAELRGRFFGWFLGDQAMFVRRAQFAALGGFREWEVFEDLDFSRRLARAGRVVTLRPPVVSSGRRFARRGAWPTTWSDFRLTLRHLRAGVPDPRRAADGPPFPIPT